MYFVYILKSLKDNRTYVGHASNPQKRLKEHNSGKVIATRHRRPLRIIFIEECQGLKETKQRKLYWKSGAGRRNLKRLLSGFPPRFRK